MSWGERPEESQRRQLATNSGSASMDVDKLVGGPRCSKREQGDEKKRRHISLDGLLFDLVCSPLDFCRTDLAS